MRAWFAFFLVVREIVVILWLGLDDALSELFFPHFLKLWKGKHIVWGHFTVSQGLDHQCLRAGDSVEGMYLLLLCYSLPHNLSFSEKEDSGNEFLTSSELIKWCSYYKPEVGITSREQVMSGSKQEQADPKTKLGTRVWLWEANWQDFWKAAGLAVTGSGRGCQAGELVWHTHREGTAWCSDDWSSAAQ